MQTPSSTRSRSVKAIVAYHGLNFSGWQIQRQGERTVQAVFEEALFKVTGHRPQLIAASRTDTGVHAQGQVIQFDFPAGQPARRHKGARNIHAPAAPLTAERLQVALNYHLPEDVVVRSLAFARPGFNARFGAKAKHYRYLIHASRSKPVFDKDTCIWVHPSLDVDRMREAAGFFVGRHDFTSFSSASDDARDRRRVIRKLAIRRSGDRVTCDIIGEGFLQHQVRIMIGTLIEIGKGMRPVSDIPRLLRLKNRLKAGRTAAPHGLTLLKVYY
jgi:tRNA pseudouridine38-40 synthase